MAVEIALEANVNVGEGSKSLNALRQEFKEAQKELNGLTEGSDAYVASLKKLGKIKDEIGDLRNTINAFNPEGKVQAVTTVVGGLASGFQAATGAAALFGGQSKDLEKALLKVQAVMAFTEGIKGLVSLGDGFKVLGAIIKSNPIFLIVGAIIAVGTTLYELKDKIPGVAKAFEVVGKVVDTVIQGFKDLTDWLGITSFAVDENRKKIIDSQEAIKKSVSDRYDTEIAVAKAAHKETTQLEIDKVKAARAANEEIIRVLKEKGESASDEEKKKITELTDANRQYTRDILGLYATAHNKFVENNKKQVEDYKKAQEEKKKAQEDGLEHSKKVLDDDYTKWKATEDQKKADRDKARQDELDGEIDLQQAKDTARLAQAELNSFNNQNDLQATLQLLKVKQDQEIESTNATGAAKELIRAKYAKLAKDAELKDKQDRLQLASDLTGALSNLSDIYFSVKRANLQKGSKEDLEAAKKQFNVNKGLQIAQATITGIQSVMNAYQSGLAYPYVGPATGAIFAVIAGIAAAANIAKIASTKFDEGGGGGSGTVGDVGGGAGTTPTPPTINSPSSSNTQLNPDGTVNTTGQQGSQLTVKAVVVETDITSTQGRVSALENNAKIH